MMLGLLGAANRYIEYGSGRLDIAIWYRDSAFVIKLKSISQDDLTKLGITREYKELEAATNDEESRIRTWLAVLRDLALKQIEEKQYATGFIQRHPEVKTIRCYCVAFCRRWVEIAMNR